MEDHVLSAAMKLSHGEDLRTMISCLHEGIKASEDVLTCNPEAFNWFHLSIPTDLLNCQPLQSLSAAEINYLSLLLNRFQNPVGLENAAGLASPPCMPKGFPSASAILQLPCINPQLLDLDQLRLNEDVHEHEEQTVPLDNSDGRRQVCREDSDGRNGESRGKNGEDKDAAVMNSFLLLQCAEHAFTYSFSSMINMHSPQGEHAFSLCLPHFLHYVLHVFASRPTHSFINLNQ